MDKYDKNKDGVLDPAEVKEMLEHILAEVSPGLGGVTDEDVDTVMRLGGEEARHTISPAEVPHALSLVLAIKKVETHTHRHLRRTPPPTKLSREPLLKHSVLPSCATRMHAITGKAVCRGALRQVRRSVFNSRRLEKN